MTRDPCFRLYAVTALLVPMVLGGCTERHGATEPSDGGVVGDARDDDESPDASVRDAGSGQDFSPDGIACGRERCEVGAEVCMNRCHRRGDGGTERVPVCVERTTRDAGPFGPPFECPGMLEGGGLNVACDGPEDCTRGEVCVWQGADGLAGTWCSGDATGGYRVCQETRDCQRDQARCVSTEELLGDLYETGVGLCVLER